MFANISQVVKLVIATAFFLFFSLSANAEYPEKPIKIVVSFPVGSSTDILARLLSEPLGQELGQAIVIENRPGAEGYIGALFVAKAPPDGYTLSLAPTGVFVTPLLRKNPAYDPLKDFTLISRVGDFSAPLLVVSAKSQYQDLNKIISKISKGGTFYGTGNVSGILAAEQIKVLLGAEATQVPYKGEPESLVDLISGRLDWMFVLPTVANAHIQSRTIYPIATTGTRRDSFFPSIPSITESVQPELRVWEEIGSLVAIIGPVGIDKGTTKKLSSAMAAILKRPDVQDRLNKLVFLTQSSTPDELLQIIKLRTATWQRLIEKSAIPKQE